MLANSRALLVSYLMMMLDQRQRLGFLVNWDKSHLTPTQSILYLS